MIELRFKPIWNRIDDGREGVIIIDLQDHEPRITVSLPVDLPLASQSVGAATRFSELQRGSITREQLRTFANALLRLAE